MFEIGWSEILIVAIVALVVVGPKDLPVLLRSIGRYAGMAKRQVAAFRAELDTAMKSADLDLVHKEMEALQSATNREISSARKSAETPGEAAPKDAAG